jgi:hypothetical protein
MKNQKQQSSDVLHEDTAAIKQAREGAERVREILQRFSVEAERVMPGSVTKGSQIQEAISNPRRYLETVIMSRMPDNEHGLPVNKAERLKSLRFPDISALEDLRENWRQAMTHTTGAWCYDLQDGEVVIDEPTLEQSLDRFRLTVAEGEDAKRELVELHQGLARSYNALRDYCNKTYGENNAGPLLVFANRWGNFDINRILKDTGTTVQIEPGFIQYMSGFKILPR